MSGKPAARVGDMIFCSLPQVIPAVPPVPHAPPPGLPIIPPGALTVLIGGKPAARMGDMSLCVTPVPVPNPIVRGAFPVPIMNMPAARMTDSGTHPGSVIMPPCCPTVLIGLAGVAGNVRVGNQMCQQAANGRTSGSTQQSYGNCGIESSRQVINQATGANLTENGMMATHVGPGPYTTSTGGTGPASRSTILTNNRVTNTTQAATLDNLGLAMSRGQGVVAGVDAAALWPTTVGSTPSPGSFHAVTVTGVEYNDNGDVTHVIINDTGTSTANCGMRVPVATWNNATNAYHSTNQGLNVTNNPIF
ncbi:MAG: PAAR domain-containing protein [Candidatus Thiodiazotropha sp.]